jgi:hypothetical protein
VVYMLSTASDASVVIVLYFLHIVGPRGGVVFKALCYKLAVAGSIPDGFIGIFQ